MTDVRKITSLLLIFIAMVIFSPAPADAGISLGKGGITLASGQTAEMCDVWIYGTQEGGTYHVETTGDLEPLTTAITPNDFTLDPIQCPEEKTARRACVTEKCLSGNQSSCKVVCVKFTAPLLFQFSPENAVYTGSILNSIRIGAATVKEPYEFSVHVEPIDMNSVVFAIAVAIIIVILILIFVKKTRKRKK